MKNILNFLLAIFLGIQFISCSKESEKQPAAKTPSYKLFKFDKKSGNCDSIKTPCAEIKFEYPQITDASNKEAMDKINQAIMSALLAPYGEDKTFSNFDSMAIDFLESFKEFKNQFPDMHQSWSIERNISVSDVNSLVFSLTNIEYYYMGGAHPNSTTSFINFSMKTGKAMELDDLLKPSFEIELNRIGEKIFREKQHLKQGESLTKVGYWFDNDKFELNDNFLIKDNGLLFIYNAYEIAAYAVGQIEIFIPYSDINDLIKEDSILKLYLN